MSMRADQQGRESPPSTSETSIRIKVVDAELQSGPSLPSEKPTWPSAGLAVAAPFALPFSGTYCPRNRHRIGEVSHESDAFRQTSPAWALCRVAAGGDDRRTGLREQPGASKTGLSPDGYVQWAVRL